jgi:hypothetical protein
MQIGRLCECCTVLLSHGLLWRQQRAHVLSYWTPHSLHYPTNAEYLSSSWSTALVATLMIRLILCTDLYSLEECEIQFYITSTKMMFTGNCHCYNSPFRTINSTEQSPSWEVASCSGTPKFSNILRDPEVHYLVHKSPYWSLTWTKWIQPISPHNISLRSILKLSYQLS